MREDVYLIIHGFAGSTDEIDYLDKYLCEKGLDTRTVLLAGHGKTKKELKETGYADWISSAETVADGLTHGYKRISLIGFSMGGLISVHLASLPAIDKIVFINTPIYFWNMKVILGDVIKGIRSGRLEKIAYYKKSLLGVSIKSGIDFLKILSSARKRLKGIKKQSLIVQCVNDESVHFKSAAYLKEKIGGRAGLRYYDGGCHQVFTNSAELRDAVCGDIYQFLVTEADEERNII